MTRVMIVNQTGYLMSFCRREEEIYIYPYASIEFKKLLNTQNCLIRKDKESDEVVLTDAFNIILNDSEVVSETPDVHDYKTEILTSESGRWFRGSTIQRNHKPDGRFAFKVSTKPPPIGSCWKWTLYLHCIASDVCLFRENSRIAIQNTTGSEIILKHFNSSENQKDYTHPETTSNEVKVGHQSLVQFQNLSGKSCLKFHVVVENQNYFLADAFRSVQQPWNHLVLKDYLLSSSCGIYISLIHSFIRGSHHHSVTVIIK